MKAGKIIIPLLIVGAGLGALSTTKEAGVVAAYFEFSETDTNQRQKRRDEYCIQASEEQASYGKDYMRSTLAAECGRYCDYVTGNLNRPTVVSTYSDIMSDFYGPISGPNGIVEPNHTITGCKYKIDKMRSDSCGASVIFTINAEDAVGGRYTLKRTVGFEQALRVTEVGSNRLSGERGWRPLSDNFGLISQEKVKTGGGKKGVVDTVKGWFSDSSSSGFQKPPAKFLRGPTAKNPARNLAKGNLAPQNPAQGRMARANRG